MSYVHRQFSNGFDSSAVAVLPGLTENSWRVIYSDDEVGRVGKIEAEEFVGSVIVSDTQYRLLQGTGVAHTLKDAAADVVAAWCRKF